MVHKKQERQENETKSMGGVIIVFKNPNAERKKLCKFCREFYGYKDHSQKGKYTYQRKGLLDEIPHVKINPVRTAIVVREEDSKKILAFLKKYGTTVYARKVELLNEDFIQIKEDKNENESNDKKE